MTYILYHVFSDNASAKENTRPESSVPSKIIVKTSLQIQLSLDIITHNASIIKILVCAFFYDLIKGRLVLAVDRVPSVIKPLGDNKSCFVP